jgi:hypothetical protein
MGPQIYDALGSKGESLQEALSYSTDAEQVVLAASGYLYVTGFVYSFMAVSVMLFPLMRDGGGQGFRC